MLNGKQIKRKAFITKLCVKGATCSVSAQNFNCPFRGSKHQTIIWYHLIPTFPDTRFKVYTYIIPLTASSICQAHSFRLIKWIMQTKQVLRPIYSALLTCVQSPPAGADLWWPNINSCILTVLWTLFNAGLNPRSKQQTVLKSSLITAIAQVYYCFEDQVESKSGEQAAFGDHVWEPGNGNIKQIASIISPPPAWLLWFFRLDYF